MGSFAPSVSRLISLLRSDLIVLKAAVPSNFLRVGINFKYFTTVCVHI